MAYYGQVFLLWVTWNLGAQDAMGSSSSLGTPMPTFATFGKSLQEIVSFTRMRYRSSRVSGLRDLRAGVWGLSCQGLRATLRGLRCFRKKGC